MRTRTRIYFWITSTNSFRATFIIAILINLGIFVQFIAPTLFFYGLINLLWVEILPIVIIGMRVNSDKPPVRPIIKCAKINQFHSVSKHLSKQIRLKLDRLAP